MIQKTASGFGVIEKEQSQLAVSTARLLPEVSRLTSLIAALQRYSGGKTQFVDPKTAAQMRQLRGEAERVEASWRDLQAEAGRLAKEMRGVANPTEEQVSAFRQVVAAAGRAKAEYLELQTSIHALQGTQKSSAREFLSAVAPMGAFNAQIADTKAKTDALNAAMDRYRNGSGGMADAKTAAAMRQQAQAVDQARLRWEALRAEANQLNAAMRAGGGAAASQSQKFREVSAAANLAEKEFKEAAAALRQLEHSSNAGIFGKINRESRQAMSVFQRLRGEVLALATAYVGLYGTISNVGGVISAYQQLEAAQNRLGAVFQQDDSKVAQELGFIERQAARLGIEFGTLANQYSKFAISAQAANFTNEETRKVFLSVAEAGRVNKLSLEDMNGIFLALTQMIQKGRIGSEELRQQLGERLPGAINIMADALGVGTAELAKMMEAGEVLANPTNLLKFADQLDKRFGSQLPKALQSTTTEIGKFWNNIYQAQLRVAEGGFIESYNALLQEMNEWFQSREGRDFFLSLGAAAGKVVDVLKMVAENFDIVMKLVSGLVALKVSAWMTGIVNGAIASARNINLLGASVTGLATKQTVAAGTTSRLMAAFTTAGGAAQTFGASLLTVQGRAATLNGAMLLGSTALTTFTTKAGIAAAGARAMSGAMAVAAGGVRVLGVALNALGGPVGILITLATIIGGSMLADWATGVDSVTASLDEHQRIMGEVLTAYDAVKGKTEAWRNAIENVSLDQANANVRAMMTLFDEARAKAVDLSVRAASISMNPFDDASDAEARRIAEAVRDLGAQFVKNKMTAIEYRKALQDLYDSTDSSVIQEYLEGLLGSARATEEAADQAALAAEAAQGLGSAIDIVTQALGLSEKRIKDQAEASKELAGGYDAAAESAKVVDEAIEKLKEHIPGLKEEMDALKTQTELTTAAWQGFTAALAAGDFGKAMEILGLLGQAGKAGADAASLKGFGYHSDSMEASSALMRKFEGFRATAYWDVNAYRAGYGSDTVTLADGSIVKITEGMRVSIEDAERDLARRIGEFQGVVVGQIGKERFDSFNADQQAVLTSVAYNYGSLPDRILDAVRTGTDAEIAAAIRNLGSDNGGINSGRRNTEAAIFERAPDGDGAAKAIAEERKEHLEAEKKITEEKAKQQEATDKALADLGFENEMLEKKMAGKDREVFIEEELRRLREQNPNITDAELAQAEALLNKKWDYQQALTAEKDEKKQIKEIEQQINDLETQRNALLAQRKIYEEQGNTEKMKEVDGEIAAVNQKLQEAIEKSIAMMQALGGEGADAAIAKMKTLGLEIGNANMGGQRFAMTAQQMSEGIFQNLESGIIGAFQSFAQAIANGEDAVESLGNAFRQFAANFLLEIAQMIIKQTLFNSLQAFSKSLGGGLFNFLSMHTGGVVGSSGGGTIAASPAWFNNAMRYHTGGIAGLAPDEVPAILRVGEEVLTETDPRHRANGGGASTGKGTKVVNMFDAASFLSEALNSKIGEEAILNYVRANPGAFKAALG